jgi:hypothetical protein
MALIAPTYEIVQPSYMMPDIIMPYSQESGAFNLLAGGQPRVMIGTEDLVVYMKRLDVRTKTSLGQAAYNVLNGPDIVASMIQAPTYLIRVHTEYDHHDQAAAGRWGFSLADATRLANQQAVVNISRTLLLYGGNPANGEGLLNANGAVAITLPPDSYGNTTASTYDNGQMAQFFQTMILNVKIRTNNLGIGRKFVFCGPQRILGQFGYNIVQLVQYQRPGAGSTSTFGVVEEVLMSNGDTVMFTYDDTLIGKGVGNTDAVILTMPEVERPRLMTPQWSTNRFTDLTPSISATTLQFCDMPVPREITAPLAYGALDTLFEERVTPGWAIRPEAVTILSISP